MNENRFTPLMYCHLFALILVAVVSAVSFSALLKGDATLSLSGIWMHVSLLLSVICGILYLCSGYSKRSAIYYKAFMLLKVFCNLFHLNIAVAHRGFDLAAIIICVKIILLLALAFWKNLGKKNTWILFYILLTADLFYGIYFALNKVTLHMIVSDTLANLLTDGTIGLAIKGKYDDKDARGTI